MDERTFQIIAHYQIKLHPDNAAELVRQCIDGTVEWGDEHGFNFWNGVLRAIEEWERQRQKPAH